MIDENKVKSMIEDRVYYVYQELKELREKIENLMKVFQEHIERGHSR